MQSWVGGGTASIMVQSSRFHLDPTCIAALDNLKAPDCPIGEDVSQTTVTSRRPPQPTVSLPSATISSGASVGEIGGVTVGIVIIVLLAILIVLLILVMTRKWKSKFSNRFACMGHSH